MTADDLNLREQITRIDQMIADIEHKMADRRRMDEEIAIKRRRMDEEFEHKIAERRHMNAKIEQTQAETDHKRIEIVLAPWGMIISMATALAAYFAAGVALMKIFG